MRDILPHIQYMAYIEIAHQYNGYQSKLTDSELWATYRVISNHMDNLSCRQISQIREIWPVFKRLFKKEKIKS